MNASKRFDLLRQMMRIRMFEEKVIELIERKELEPGFHLLMGHEAVTVGVCRALGVGDYITSNHRTMGRYLCRGGSMKKLMAEIFGRATGLCKGKAGEMLIADRHTGLIFSSVTVGAGIPVAVGAALGIKYYTKKNQVVAALFGDAASGNALFHEALNLAAVNRAPVLFVCENNGLSINIPQREWMSGQTVAQKATGYGIPGVQIDGSDVEDVYRTATKAIMRARNGRGPTLIDAKVVRLRPHKEGMADTRSRREMASCWKKDPILLYAGKLKVQGLLTNAKEAAMRHLINEEVEEAVGYARASPVPETPELFTDLYTERTTEIFSRNGLLET